MFREQKSTETQAQAKFGAVICALAIFLIYFFEFSGTNINNEGITKDVVGIITQCSDSRDRYIKIGPSGKGFYISLDTTGERLYYYSRPDTFRGEIYKACNTYEKVKLSYQTYQPLLYDWTGYKVVSLLNEKNGRPYFTQDDYFESKSQNRLVAVILLVLASIALVYLVLVWLGILRNRDINKVKNKIRLKIEDEEHLVIKSSERNGDSIAFLILFVGWTVFIIWQVYSGKDYAWLIAAAITAIIAYAYLVEVVNSNYFAIDDEYLVSYTSPLPWINQAVVFDVDDIDYFIGEEQLHSTSQGPILEYPVAVKLLEEPEPVHLFFTRDLAEAEAIADLANEKIGRKG